MDGADVEKLQRHAGTFGTPHKWQPLLRKHVRGSTFLHPCAGALLEDVTSVGRGMASVSSPDFSGGMSVQNNLKAHL